MNKDNRTLLCIFGNSMRDLLKMANELEIKKEDIVQFFELNHQIYLVYYK